MLYIAEIFFACLSLSATGRIMKLLFSQVIYNTPIRNTLACALVAVLFWVECYCVTYYKDNTGGFLNTSILFIVVGLMISFIPFLTKPLNDEHISPFRPRWLTAFSATLLAAGIAALIVYCYKTAAAVFPLNPYDYHYADMIPQIRACVLRFINGEKVYAPMPDVWNGMNPTYLPAMWLPWIPFEVFTNDLRWTAVFFLVSGITLMAAVFPFRNTTAFVWITALGFTVWQLVHFMYETDIVLLVHIHEAVVVGFYLLLGYGLVRGNPWVIGIGMGCCLMSRYVLIFWIPAFIVYTYFFDSRRNAYIIFAIVSAMFLFIFLIPYWLPQPTYFSETIAYYHECTLRFMLEQRTANENLGLAKLFNAASLPWLIRLETLAALIPPLGMLLFFIRKKESLQANKSFFGLCSLKLTMVFFYAFVEIPFSYLFFVPVFFTLPVCIQMAKRCP